MTSPAALGATTPSNNENIYAILEIDDHIVVSLEIETAELKNDALDTPPPAVMEDTFNI